jgi:hypothetical protein
MRRIAAIIVSLAATALAAAPALSAPNPSGTGQPSQSCQDVGTGPPGITSTTNGFATRAVIVYAGSPDTESFVNGNPHAVSQYDVACYQFSQH